MTYQNTSTERVALWLSTSAELAAIMQPIATDDPNATKTEKKARELISGAGGLGPDQRATAAIVRDEVALADVHWPEVRDEINSVEL